MTASFPRFKRWRTGLLATAMVFAIGAIAALGVMDERSLVWTTRIESSREPRVLAEVLAAEFRAGLSAVGGDEPAGTARVEGGVWRFADTSLVIEPRMLLHEDVIANGGDLRLLVWATATDDLRTIDGEPVDIPSVIHAAAAGEKSAWLTPGEAHQLGLPEELAVAGLSRVEDPRFGEWIFAVVSSSERQRARESRRYARTIVMVGLASLVVLGFGLVLLRTQRQERAFERMLARESLRVQQEVQLAREGRAATMLTFAAGIAHELSTPLGVIAMRAEQLENNAEDDRARRGARAITEQVAKIRENARGFLAIARGAAPLRERFPAVDVLRSVVARVGHRFDRAGVALRVVAQPDLPWIYGDARLLEHALTNLLINACDASPVRGVVELSAELDDKMLTFAVRDRGAGIDAAVRARIQPFFSTKAEGTGLGLAIASEVMRMHRGELKLEERPGGGTNAVLRLPAESMSDDVVAHEAQDAHPVG
ncbi:HAMP domain-containing sensor histidine kinase [Nannocystis sp. SCPEA4]|uniref:sensor histidine kinase n=1 Tax=Nannocystis sp. SCPEA4 TaxID=2996787 RepID=UPI00226F61D4|nr:HAMP domain-containing sensor histidine kinase [Nannocystis sp. SCPEA4]MCY1060423.1 HAMP domain-containing sensor histidine kinase [Nannocystis sp. SCPEA4]